jgi:hypothetical protein
VRPRRRGWPSVHAEMGACEGLPLEQDDLLPCGLPGRAAVGARQWPWNELTCTHAAQGGHLAVLEWARANGCLWDAQTCARAAPGGHLAVLQWAPPVGVCQRLPMGRADVHARSTGCNEAPGHGLVGARHGPSVGRRDERARSAGWWALRRAPVGVRPWLSVPVTSRPRTCAGAAKGAHTAVLQ